MNLIKRLPIRYKIIVVFVPLIVLPLIVVTITSNSIFTNSVVAISENNMYNESNLITNRVLDILDSANTSMQFLAMSLIDIYGDDTLQHSDFFELIRHNRTLEAINYNANHFNEIDYLAFIDLDFNIVSTNTAEPQIFNGVSDGGVLDALFSINHTRNIWFPLEKRDYLVKDRGVPVFTMGKKVVELITGDTLGFLVLTIREDTFSSVFPANGTDNTKSFRIVDREGQILSSTREEELFTHIENWEEISNAQTERHFTVDSMGERTLMAKFPVAQMDWWLLASVGYRELTGDAYINTLIILSVGLLCIGITVLSALLLSRLISNPIVQLTDLAEQIKSGEMSVVFDVGFADEVGVLTSAFSTMIDRIRLLIEEVENEQQTKRSIEFDLLQSQIQPHFLYNSIETINMLIRLDMKENALRMSKSLVEFYRDSLSGGDGIIKISEELRLIENYLNIQSLRYMDYLDYSIQVDDDIYDFEIPKLTLQPLVENAIYHGLKAKGEKGNLLVSGSRRNDIIFITVQDDGIGMTEEQMDNVLCGEQSESMSFGVKSIELRLQLLYGEKAGVTLESEPGTFTRATVFFPIKLA